MTPLINVPLLAETAAVLAAATALSNAVFTAAEVAEFDVDVLVTESDKFAATSKLLYRAGLASFEVACHAAPASYQRRVAFPVAAAPLSTL